MTVTWKSWLIAALLVVATIASFQGAHGFDVLFAPAADCCSHAPDATSDDDGHAGHVCCHPVIAVVIAVHFSFTFAASPGAAPTDTSYGGGLAKKIDYPPQLV